MLLKTIWGICTNNLSTAFISCVLWWKSAFHSLQLSSPLWERCWARLHKPVQVSGLQDKASPPQPPVLQGPSAGGACWSTMLTALPLLQASHNERFFLVVTSLYLHSYHHWKADRTFWKSQMNLLLLMMVSLIRWYNSSPSFIGMRNYCSPLVALVHSALSHR